MMLRNASEVVREHEAGARRGSGVIGLAVLLAMALATTGCFTMHFDHAGAGTHEDEFSEWHHGGIFRLVEFSDPVDLKARCEGRAAVSHTVEQSFLNGLASSISYGLYDGWTVRIDCP